MADTPLTREVCAGTLKAGDRILVWGAICPVEGTERVGANTVRVRLARERLGFVEHGYWQPVYCNDTIVRLVVQP